MGRVVAAIDGSERSIVALSHAAVFARAFRHDLVAFHVVDPVPEETIMPSQGRIRVARRAAEFERTMQPTLKKYRCAFRTIFQEPGESVAEALARASAEEGAVLLGLGTRGASSVSRVLLGGVALGLLAIESPPLLLTGAMVEVAAAKRIHYGVLSLNEDAVGGASLARMLHAAIAGAPSDFTVVHVETNDTAHASRGPVHFETRVSAIERLLPEKCQVAGRFERVRDEGEIVPHVLEIAAEMEANAFGLATSSHRLQRRLWGGSTALSLLKRSPLPLIVVPRR